MTVKLYPSSEIKESYRKAIKYLVKHRLMGNLYVLDSIWDYLIKGDSPSTIGRRYGISKYRVRGFVQRIYEHIGVRRAKEFALKVIPIVRKVAPLIIKSGDEYVCIKCGEVVYGSLLRHLNEKHAKEVEVLVHDVCKKTRLC